MEKLKLRQPDSGIAASVKQARATAEGIGYPIVIRPSYVLGGRAMEIVHDSAQLDRYLIRLAGYLDRPSELVVSAKDAGSDLESINADIHASEEYRKAMIPVFTARAVNAAIARA